MVIVLILVTCTNLYFVSSSALEGNRQTAFVVTKTVEENDLPGAQIHDLQHGSLSLPTELKVRVDRIDYLTDVTLVKNYCHGIKTKQTVTKMYLLRYQSYFMNNHMTSFFIFS